METISHMEQIDERRALVMSLQALLDPAMLRVVAALMDGERSMAELATALKIQPSFSRGPLGRLVFLEIVRVRQEGDSIRCRLDHRRLHTLNGALQRLSRDLFAGQPEPTPADTAESLADEDRRILRSLFRGDQLREIPSGERRLMAVLRWLVGQFEPGRRYAEREVNELIKRHHPDFATLRRNLVDYRLMAREREVYWRIEAEPAGA